MKIVHHFLPLCLLDPPLVVTVLPRCTTGCYYVNYISHLLLCLQDPPLDVTVLIRSATCYCVYKIRHWMLLC